MSQKTVQAPRTYEDYSDTVLYDVFYEAGTQFGGTLVALERRANEAGDVEAAERWRSRRFQMADERDAVRAEDRAGQVAALNSWHAEMAQLDVLLGL